MFELNESISTDTHDMLEFSQTCLERDFHKVYSSVIKIDNDVKKYVKSNIDALPDCVDMYDNGTYTADDLRAIVRGCYEDFQFILQCIEHAREENEKTQDDFYNFTVKF